MYKYELLKLLDDPDIKEKIQRIVEEPKNFVETDKKIPQPVETEKFPSINDDEKISKLEDEKTAALQRATVAERQLENLRGENYQLKNSLAKTQQRVKDLEQQIQNAQYTNSRLENSLTESKQTARSFQSKLEEWQRTFNREQQRARNLQADLDAAQREISRLEDLIADLKYQNEQRFARGWELFQKYQRVGSHARQLLQGVFPHENFMSFICGGAQTNSLETLWDVLRECVMSNRQQDADILSEVFEYCFELVNSSKTQAGYSILPVKVGDRFDSDLHSEGPNSRAQGKVAAIYLPGYRNDYNGRVIRKSIVQVS